MTTTAAAMPARAPDAPSDINEGKQAILSTYPDAPAKRYNATVLAALTCRSRYLPTRNTISMLPVRCQTDRCRNTAEKGLQYCPPRLNSPKLAPQRSNLSS